MFAIICHGISILLAGDFLSFLILCEELFSGPINFHKIARYFKTTKLCKVEIVALSKFSCMCSKSSNAAVSSGHVPCHLLALFLQRMMWYASLWEHGNRFVKSPCINYGCQKNSFQCKLSVGVHCRYCRCGTLVIAMSVRICSEELFVLLFMSSCHAFTGCETLAYFCM